MDRSTEPRITELLLAWREGDSQAREEIVPAVYGDLRRLAESYLQAERRDHTLQATALVHEAYLKLQSRQHPRWHDGQHFFAVAALLMRRILVDHARARSSRRRGGEWARVPFEEVRSLTRQRSLDLLAIDQALSELEELDERKAQVVELRFFGGMTIDETATALGLSPVTVVREWRLARAWLLRRLSAAPQDQSGGLQDQDHPAEIPVH